MTYGLPTGTNIQYGSKGFPSWVYQLADAFGLKASTYPGHQEGQRAERGFAPNPQGLNRGIDFTGPVDKMQKFAEYLLSIRSNLEQVIWENPNTRQRVGVAGGDDVTTAPYYAGDYSGHQDHVHVRVSQPIPLPQGVIVRPDFNEYPVWSPNNQSRNKTRVDLFILHTEEGSSNADQLARWMSKPESGVSYHYTVSMDPRDKGVTVCDTVDTDLASWSVLSANNRSINLVFAGSRAAWSRQDWLDKAGKAIDVAGYLAVQDCKKYNIPLTVIAPPYTSGRAGITDHNYVTQILRDGTHTDVGNGFPWDVFTQAVNKYAGIKPAPAPTTPTPPKPTPTPSPVTDVDLITEFDAITYGDLDAVARVAAAARTGNRRALRVLAHLERTNPAALTAYITLKG